MQDVLCSAADSCLLKAEPPMYPTADIGKQRCLENRKNYRRIHGGLRGESSYCRIQGGGSRSRPMYPTSVSEEKSSQTVSNSKDRRWRQAQRDHTNKALQQNHMLESILSDTVKTTVALYKFYAFVRPLIALLRWYPNTYKITRKHTR